MLLLAYVSVATSPFSDEELMELLAKSRAHNVTKGITGLLLYDQANFLQLLEGPDEAVLTLLDRIRSDPRHYCLIVVLQEQHEHREFTGWSMGFQKIDNGKPMNFPGYTSYHDLPLTSEQFLLNPAKSLDFLRSFKARVHNGDYSET